MERGCGIGRVSWRRRTVVGACIVSCLTVFGAGTAHAAPYFAFTAFPISFGLNTNPTHITAGPDGNLWITEDAGNRIGRMTPTGVLSQFSSGLASGSAPDGITPGPDGNLWFTEGGARGIGRITPAGVITEFLDSNFESAARGIVSGPDGISGSPSSGGSGASRRRARSPSSPTA
jgi:streptogramin lyase